MGKTDGQRWRRGPIDAEEKAERHAWRTACDVALGVRIQRRVTME